MRSVGDELTATVRESISGRMTELSITVGELSELSGLSVERVGQILEDEGGPLLLVELVRIAVGLGVTAGGLILGSWDTRADALTG